MKLVGLVKVSNLMRFLFNKYVKNWHRLVLKSFVGCSNKYKLGKVCPSPVEERVCDRLLLNNSFWLFQQISVTQGLSVPSWRGATAMAEWWRWQHQLPAPSGIQWCTAQCEALVQHQTQCDTLVQTSPAHQTQPSVIPLHAGPQTTTGKQTHLNSKLNNNAYNQLKCEFFYLIQRIFVIPSDKNFDKFEDLTF